MNFLLLVLATMSIWEYPARQQAHVYLRSQFITAVRGGDTEKMEAVCQKGVALLPDDPVWHYNLACALAYFPKRVTEALDELEKAIDLGFRDLEAISADHDLKRISGEPRFAELVEYAKEKSTRPMLSGPLSAVDATGTFGELISLGEQNFGWDFDSGCFVAKMKLAKAASGGNTGDLYMNRDGMHSMLNTDEFPGLTTVRLDAVGRERKMDINIPNILFPYPVFGNCSMAFVDNLYWRSISRALMTTDVSRLAAMMKMYRSNQLWVFPSNLDTAPVGTNGDVFAAITPYYLTSAGRSFSDKPYVSAALRVSRALKPAVKAEIVKRGMLSPVIQTLIRKSLKGVNSEDDYLTAAAHPTALPPDGVDTGRLERAAAAFKVENIAPLAPITVESAPVKENKSKLGECIYATTFAWSFVLRAEDVVRQFLIKAQGDAEFEFRQTHGTASVRIDRLDGKSARVVLDRTGMSPTNRVDIAVFARSGGSGWGAPSYVSFAVVDPDAEYSDPVLTPRPDGKE